MWIIFSFLSALFAGITSILAKLGIRKTNSTLATAIRTIVVLIFSWLLVIISGTYSDISNISTYSLVFLVLSGLATGASWLCYFKALSLGEVNKVVPVDKMSAPMSIILAFIVLGDEFNIYKLFAVVLITMGTYLMIDRKTTSAKNNTWSWLPFSIFSAVFAALTSIFAKIGIVGIDSNLATAIRTCVVLLMAWICVFSTGHKNEINKISKNELAFIILSGIATGVSWLCFYKALSDGIASAVIPIDKLSIIVTIVFSRIVFKEKLSKIAFAGLILLIVGTIFMLI